MRSGVIVEVGDPAGVEGGAASDDAVHGVALVKQELSKVRPVLTCTQVNRGVNKFPGNP